MQSADHFDHRVCQYDYLIYHYEGLRVDMSLCQLVMYGLLKCLNFEPIDEKFKALQQPICRFLVALF